MGYRQIMGRSIIYCLLLLSIITTSDLLFARAGDTSDTSTSPRIILNARISQEETDLPQEMYGGWQRARTLIKSNFPNNFVSFEMGYWFIEKANNQIVLTNPTNGIQSTIHVENVQGNKAQFHYSSRLANGMNCVEELNLTVFDATLSGTQKKTCSDHQGNQYTAFANVQAEQINPNFIGLQLGLK